MQKQLNPQLFGSSFSSHRVLPRPPSQSFELRVLSKEFAQATLESPRPDNAVQIQSLEEKIERLLRQTQEFQGQITQLAFHSEENLKGVRVKSDRLQQKVQQVELKQDSLVIETSQKSIFCSKNILSKRNSRRTFKIL
jgi:TolA-binding protein